VIDDRGTEPKTFGIEAIAMTKRFGDFAALDDVAESGFAKIWMSCSSWPTERS
jgi:hypothetical protein